MASESVSQTIDAHTRLYALLGDFSGIGFDILVNATSVGMAPKIDRMHRRGRGGMFVHQGACQFERWTGKRAPVQLMKRTVLAALKKMPQEGNDRHD